MKSITTKNYNNVINSLKAKGYTFEQDLSYRLTQNLFEVATPFVRIFKNGVIVALVYGNYEISL